MIIACTPSLTGFLSSDYDGDFLLNTDHVAYWYRRYDGARVAVLGFGHGVPVVFTREEAARVWAIVQEQVWTPPQRVPDDVAAAMMHVAAQLNGAGSPPAAPKRRGRKPRGTG